MSVLRRARTWIVIGGALAILGALVIVALPPLARRVLVVQLRAATNRDVSIAKVGLNLFTRRLSVAGFRLADRAGGPPTLEFERLDVAFRLWPLLRGRVQLDALALEKPALRVVRVAPGQLDVSDVIERFLSGPPRKEPTPITIAHLLVTGGSAVFEDRALSPSRTWQVGALRFEARDLATVADRADGRAELAFEMAGAPFTVSIEGLRVRPARARASVSVRGLALDPFWAYVLTPTTLRPDGGRFDTRLTVDYDAVDGVRAGGEVRIVDLAMVRPGETTAVVSTPTLVMSSRDIVYRDGAVRAGRLEISGAPTIVDARVSPPRRLELRSLQIGVDGFAWPPRGTAQATLEAELPEGGHVTVTGTAELAAQAVDLTVQARDVSLATYRRFLPRELPVSGRAAASLRVTAVASEWPRVTVTGTASASRVTLGSGERPPVAVERVELAGLDAAWPDRVRAARLTVRKPSALLEREKDGSFPLRQMLAPAASRASPTTAAPPSPSSASPTAAAPAASPSPALAFELGELTLVDGDVRFVDRTTAPFYSEEISRLAVTVRNLRSAPGARADLAIQGIVGAAAALDLRGQVAPFGEPFYLDVAGELRDFAVPRVNPYVRRFVDWVVGSGRLTTKLHYRVHGDELDAKNDIVVERLAVERAGGPDADKKIGVPLGLAVAILKDARGDIRLSVPVGGRLSAPEFSFGEAVATALKNIVTRLVTAPFRAIGRIFQKGDAVEAVAIDPLPFEPGSASLGPDAQKHLQRVADVLRGTPRVKLALKPVVGARDLAALRARAATARVQQRQREEKLAEFADAAVRAFKATFPDRPVPKATEDVVAELAARETVSDEDRRALAARRLEVARQALVGEAGIEPNRLEESTLAAEPRDAGGIEFDLTPS